MCLHVLCIGHTSWRREAATGWINGSSTWQAAAHAAIVIESPCHDGACSLLYIGKRTPKLNRLQLSFLVWLAW